MTRPRAERETLIRRADDEDVWDIYTESPALMRRLRRLAQAHGLACQEVGTHGLRVVVPVAWLRIAAPRGISEAQRAALARARDRRVRPAGAVPPCGEGRGESLGPGGPETRAPPTFSRPRNSSAFCHVDRGGRHDE